MERLDLSTKQVTSLKTIVLRPQMRLFWYFFPFLVALIAVQFFYLSGTFVLLFSLVVLSLTGLLMFWVSYRLALGGADVKEELKELRSIVLTIEDGVVAYDHDFKIVFFNKASEKVFHLTQEEVLGMRVTPQDAEEPKFQRFVQVLFPSLAPQMVARTPTGSYPQVSDLSFEDPLLELRVTTAPILDDKGVSLGFVKTIRDRTQEVSLIKSKSEFITVASHQLRTPITEIRWALESLASSIQGVDDATRTLIESTSTAAKELARITEDLLSIAKIEEGRFGYTFQSINIIDFLGKMLEQMVPLVQHAEVKLYFERPQGVIPPVIADTQKLSIVIANLIENATRYNVKNGQIVVKVRQVPDQPYVEVTIADTGIGISQEDIEKMFGKFFRAGNAVRFQTQGSGLGLYICKNVIRAHGGQIWVESELNRGSVFHFTLTTDPNAVPSREAPAED